MLRQSCRYDCFVFDFTINVQFLHSLNIFSQYFNSIVFLRVIKTNESFQGLFIYMEKNVFSGRIMSSHASTNTFRGKLFTSVGRDNFLPEKIMIIRFILKRGFKRP